MKSRPAAELTIGHLAARFGLATSVLRYWESAAVLRPAARVSGRRRYSEDDGVRVAAILVCKEAGLTLRETRDVLSGTGAKRRRRAFAAKIDALDQRIAQAQRARGMIAEAMACPARDPLRCEHFRAWITTRASATRA